MPRPTRGVGSIEPGTGTVYFAAFREWGVRGLKVGCTGNLPERRKGLRAWLGPTMRILATAPGERAVELRVLEALRPYRMTRRKPEYFFLTPKVMSVVAAARAGRLEAACP